MIPSPREQLEVALAASKPISDAPRHPLAVEPLLTESLRKTAFPDSLRAKCIRLLGHEIREFLSTRQPDFEDRLGSEILQDSPAELLAALERRQRDYDAADFGPAQHRKESEVARVLDLLDNLEKGKEGRD